MKKLMALIVLLLVLAACGPAGNMVTETTPTAPAPSITTQPSGSTSAPQAASGAVGPAARGTAAGIPNFDHIVLIVLENQDYSTALDSSKMPHLVDLAQKYVLLTDYYAASHPSLPNYLALMSGSTQGVTSDCLDCFVNAKNLADELDKAGKTWKAYLESMPSPCFVGNADPYAQKHNPLLYFDSIRLNASLCDKSIVPMTQLDADLKTNQLPNFAFIAPNLCNSGHDCSPATADKWLKNTVGKLQDSSALGKNSLIVITFDEAKDGDKSSCCGLGKGGGHVAAILISPLARPEFQDNTPYSHYSLLKTILAAWNLPEIGRTNQSTIRPIVAPWSDR